MNKPSFDDLTDALSTPIGKLISTIGINMADAQQELDASTIENLKMIYNEGDQTFEELRKIGYQPSWYQIPEVSAEINMALTVSGTSEESGKRTSGRTLPRKGRIQLYAIPVDATFTNKYGFEYQASSKIQFRVVPVPPSPTAEGIRVAPGLEELTLELAEQMLQNLNIEYRLHDKSPAEPDPHSLIKTQSIAPGEIIYPGQPLILTLEP